MKLSEDLNVFICHKGLERSPSATTGFKTAGFPSTCFEGGTRYLKTLNPEKIAALVPTQALVTIIFDVTDSPESTNAKNVSVAKLQALRYALQIVDTQDIRIQLYNLGLNPDEFFPIYS